ncbi:MAG TPA: hypothetical protein ACFYEC_01495 [Candidatus Brocadiaceae bacterium]
MPDIIVQDIDPRNQYTAGGGLPTVFAFTFPIFALTDIVVYQTPVGQAPNDVTQVLTYNVDYTVTNNIAPAVGGTITLTIGAPAGDIITIVRDLPDNRLNNYVDGGLFQATDVNTDFDRCVMMNQQNKLYKAVPGSIGVGYNNSAVITPIVDNILPLLPANCVWQMNSTHTQIQAVLFNAGQGGGGAVLPTVVNHFATFSNTTGTIQDSGFRAPLVDGNANDVMITDGAFNTSFTNVVNVLPASISGVNRIVNGDLQVWQRGAGGTTTFTGIAGGTTQYTADRWQIEVGGASNVYVNQFAGTTSGSYLAQVGRTAANADVSAIIFATSLMRDMCIGAAGNYITLSFKARKGANYSAAANALGVVVYSGTGATDVSGINGNYPGFLTPINTTVTLTNALTQFTITSAAVVGATATQLSANFSLTPTGAAGADDAFYITDVQLEVSRTATPFERRDFNSQLLECQRYYVKSFLYSTAPVQNAGAGTGEELCPITIAAATTNVSQTIHFPVQMRVNNPTVTFYNPAAANAQARDETAAGDCTNTATSNLSARGFALSVTGNAGGTVGGTLGVHWQADCDII